MRYAGRFGTSFRAPPRVRFPLSSGIDVVTMPADGTEIALAGQQSSFRSALIAGSGQLALAGQLAELIPTLVSDADEIAFEGQESSTLIRMLAQAEALAFEGQEPVLRVVLADTGHVEIALEGQEAGLFQADVLYGEAEEIAFEGQAGTFRITFGPDAEELAFEGQAGSFRVSVTTEAGAIVFEGSVARIMPGEFVGPRRPLFLGKRHTGIRRGTYWQGRS